MDRTRQIVAAVTNGNADKVSDMLRRNPEYAKARTDDGGTVLHVAAARGYTEIARLLVANGADPAATDAQGATPAAVAERAGHAETAAAIGAATSR